MRLVSATFVLVVGLAPAFALHAQEARQSFNAQGATEAAACEAATRQAKDWVKRGKSEGRARALLDAGTCACTPAGNGQSCKLDVRVSDEQREEEEEG